MKITLLGALVLVLAATGCGAPSVEDVASAMRKTVTTAAAQAGHSSSALENTPALADLLSGVSGVMGSRGPGEALAPLRPLQALSARLLPREAASQLALKAVPDHGESVEAMGERLATFLEERIFTEENVEERAGDAITFRVTGEDLCRDDLQPASPQCVEVVDRFEIRIRATRAGDSLKVELQLGPGRHTPYAMQLSNAFVAASVDLAEVRQTGLYVADVLGQETIGLPRVAEGVMEVRAIQGDGEHDFTLVYSVLSAVKVQYTDPEGRSWSYQVAQRPELARLQFIEAEGRVQAEVDVPVVELSYPQTYWDYNPETWESFELGTATHVVHLGGASFFVELQQGATELRVSNLGIGDETTFQAVDGTRVVSVDLNRDAGRRFDLLLTRDDAGRAVFQVQREFDLRISLNDAPLAAYGLHFPPWALEDNLHIRFAGGSAGPSFRPVPYNYETGAEGGALVLEGTLRLETDEPGVSPVVVNPGECLIRSYPIDEDGYLVEGHPFAVQYSAGTCE